MPSQFYDTHAHLDDPRFSSDLEDVVARAHSAGIVRIICIGTTAESSRRAIALAERFPGVYAAVGWHPSYVMDAPPDFAPALRELAAHPKVVALGETGLDFLRAPKDPAERAVYKARQIELFRQHLVVAEELGLNCVVHQREAFEETVATMGPFAGKVRGVFHCFSESVERLRRVLDLGSMVSYTGIVTFKNGANIRESLKATPMGEFMFETDAPYLAPEPHRGKALRTGLRRRHRSSCGPCQELLAGGIKRGHFGGGPPVF